MQPEQENFLSRWSRRKQQATESVELEEQPALEIASGIDDGTETENSLEAAPVELVLTDADMPDINTLDEDSDFSGFMSSGVSDELRNLALKKLFKAAVFNVRDGLDEYDEDYTSFEKLGDIVTCDMKHQIEMEAKKKLEAESEALLEEGALTENEDLPGTEQTEPEVEREIEQEIQPESAQLAEADSLMSISASSISSDSSSTNSTFSVSKEEVAIDLPHSNQSNPEPEKI